jgi:hypothetical protein
LRRFYDGIVPSNTIVRASLDDTRGAIFGRAGDGEVGQHESYRYMLWRQAIDTQEKQVTWIMLNPSTADENVLDPTLRRCWSFTSQWGFNRMEIVNLFAYRATKPRGMRAQGVASAVGYHNDWFIRDSAIRAQLVMCAWGLGGKFGNRAASVVAMLSGLRIPLHYLRLTKDGAPGHPLYLPDGMRPLAFGEVTGVAP